MPATRADPTSSEIRLKSLDPVERTCACERQGNYIGTFLTDKAHVDTWKWHAVRDGEGEAVDWGWQYRKNSARLAGATR